MVNAKVRLRASIIRLSNALCSAPKLAKHFGRNLQSVHNDLDRFEQFGVEGLADGKATGATPKVTPEMETFMHSKLAEDRVWNSTLLSEAIEQAFGVRVKREAIRVKLLELGYSWKRTRYAPGKQADPEVVAEHQASLETLVLDKTAPSGPVRNLIEGVWRKLKGFLMPRRCYDNVKQLREALRVGLKALNAITI